MTAAKPAARGSRSSSWTSCSTYSQVPSISTAVFSGRDRAHASRSLLPRIAVTGAIADSASRTEAAPTSPACTICSLPFSAASACGRLRPCVSEMTPTMCSRALRLGPIALPEETALHWPPLRAPESALRPADRQQGAGRAVFGQTQPRVDLAAQRGVHGGERSAQSDRTTRQQDVLNGGEQRLQLRRAAPRPPGDKEQHRHLVQVLGQIDRRAHVAPLGRRIARVLRRLD